MGWDVPIDDAATARNKKRRIEMRLNCKGTGY
jgi:hypothetical protein